MLLWLSMIELFFSKALMSDSNSWRRAKPENSNGAANSLFLWKASRIRAKPICCRPAMCKRRVVPEVSAPPRLSAVVPLLAH
jgi:hypothetical protein